MHPDAKVFKRLRKERSKVLPEQWVHPSLGSGMVGREALQCQISSVPPSTGQDDNDGYFTVFECLIKVGLKEPIIPRSKNDQRRTAC
jgi:hypothetical protein